ncbi:MAG: phage tail protein [Clostridiales Family XIII bacterium]|jgi:phage tail-like protein|nr:phage tail protein [Clostridiales Family XIII bacterium]
MAFGTTSTVGAGAGAYPFTKMNFLVSINGGDGEAAFSEITGLDATVDVVEFRQGNSGSLSPVKIPGLVKHGNLTMKFGMTGSANFRDWIWSCVDHQRKGSIRVADIIIQLVSIQTDVPPTVGTPGTTEGDMAWHLKNAWVTKYTGSDLNALQSEVAIETIEVAFEYFDTIPLPAETSGTA